MALREVELNETNHLIFEPKDPRPCSVPKCPLRTGPAASDAYRKVFDHIVGPSQQGTKVLQVPEFYQGGGGDVGLISPDICRSCVGRWDTGHVDVARHFWVEGSFTFAVWCR